MPVADLLIVFQDMKRGGNTRSGLAREEQCRGKLRNAHSPSNCGDNSLGDVGVGGCFL
jgi:hypothetical protein